MDINSLVPHRAPMLAVDAVDEVDIAGKRVVAHARIDSGSPFFDGTGVPAWAAVEYMAQAAALLVGLRDRTLAPGENPRPGLLLGTRRLELSADRFAIDADYRISAVCEFEDADAAAFRCEMADAAGAVVASATLNAYRPPDMAKFLKEQLSA